MRIVHKETKYQEMDRKVKTAIKDEESTEEEAKTETIQTNKKSLNLHLQVGQEACSNPKWGQADSDKLYSCSECGLVFAAIEGQRSHEERHRGIKELIEEIPGCHVCGKRFNRRDSLAEHMSYEHIEEKESLHIKTEEKESNQKNIEANNIILVPGHDPKTDCVLMEADTTQVASSPAEPQSYICSSSKCKTEFKTEEEFEIHVDIVHKDILVDDKMVLKLTSELSAALNALQKENPEIMEVIIDDTAEETTKKVNQEPIKTEPTNQIQNIRNGEEIFNCNKCNFHTNSSRNIRIHKRTIHETSQNTCNVCPQILKTNESLLLHVKQKHGIKIECEKCDFKTKSSLVMKVHARKLHQTYLKCDKCAKELKTKTEMSLHMRTHRDAFKCMKCTFNGTSRKDLSTHSKKGHGENTTPQRGTKRANIQSPEYKIDPTQKTEEKPKQITKKPKKGKLGESPESKFPFKECDVIGGAGYKIEEKNIQK